MGSHSLGCLFLLFVNTDVVEVVALSKYPDIDVEIYEGASELAEVGAGIGIFPRMFFFLRL